MLGFKTPTIMSGTVEEVSLMRLEANIDNLNSQLTAEKTKATLALADEKNKQAGFIQQGKKIERERINQIRMLPEFIGREEVALKMALSDSPEANPASIGLLLRNIPKKQTGGDQFAEYMAKLGNPDIGPDSDTDYEAENNNILQSIARGDI